MKQCTLIGHNGWTDYISQYALRRHFLKDYDICLLFVDSPEKIPFVKSLYPESHIQVCVPKMTNTYDGVETCLCCHTLGSPYQCPRSRRSCIYVDYSVYKEYTNIRLNAFDNYTKWERFMEGKSFLDAMYMYYTLDPLTIIKQYKLVLDQQQSIDFFDKHAPKNEPYVAIHDNRSTGLFIENPTSYKAFYVDGISTCLTDTLLIFDRASEIHCIDSVYLFLLLILTIQYDTFREKKVFVYYRSIHTNGPYFAIQKYLPTSWIQKQITINE